MLKSGGLGPRFAKQVLSVAAAAAAAPRLAASAQ